ncbi:hypothetical protein SKAU_G00180600 [Synaphobranchus kaupii]|uniref:Uncharacterized protein n=1 Tax=Synaphobranchus kaupii TaxID=118154 RepID=A0A9Q1FMS9_SYNKA|nr:hypothetical protein SKAU_G00180600 [Synaphobranchus kaupii]
MCPLGGARESDGMKKRGAGQPECTRGGRLLLGGPGWARWPSGEKCRSSSSD